MTPSRVLAALALVPMVLGPSAPAGAQFAMGAASFAGRSCTGGDEPSAVGAERKLRLPGLTVRASSERLYHRARCRVTVPITFDKLSALKIQLEATFTVPPHGRASVSVATRTLHDDAVFHGRRYTSDWRGGPSEQASPGAAHRTEVSLAVDRPASIPDGVQVTVVIDLDVAVWGGGPSVETNATVTTLLVGTTL